MALPADANLVVGLDFTSATWQDTAGTTPATANNAIVQRWDDISGNGFNATLIGGDSNGTLKTGVYAQKHIAFATSRFTLGQPTALVNAVNGASGYTVFMAYKITTPTNQGFLFTKNNTGRINFFNAPGVSGNSESSFYWGLSSATYYGPFSDSTQPHTFAYAYYPSEQIASQRIFVAGAAVSDKAGSPGTTDAVTDFALGGIASGTTTRFAGDFLCLYVYSRPLSPAEITTLSDTVYSNYGLTNPRLSSPYNLVFSGNSLLTLAGAPGCPEKIRRILGLPMGSVHNLGIGGQTNSQMITDDPGRLDGLLAKLSNPLLCGWECSNEQNTTTYASWGTARKTFGWPRVMIGTVLPRANAGFNTTRNTQNPTIRAYASTVCDAICDVAADPTIGIDTAGFDVSLYGDGIHFVNNGAWFVEKRWCDAIKALMAPASYTAAANVRSGTDRGDGVTGTLALPPANKVLAGTTFDASTAGTATVPAVGLVRAGTTYGTGGTALTGTVAEPAVTDVKSGVQYGAGGVEFTGTLAAGFPTVSQIAAAILVTPSQKIVTSAAGAVQLDLGQAVPTSNAAQTVGDSLNAARAQGFGRWQVVGNILSLYAADGTTVVRSFTLNSPTAPTERA
jgi:hypothetical protein